MERFKKTIKKIAAIAGGAVMVGASMAGALAALDKLPAPFVTPAGVFDSYLVVGTLGWNPNAVYNADAVKGLARDVAAGIDVGAAFAQKATTAVAGSSTTLTGEVYAIEKSGDKLEFGQNIDVYGSVTDTELAKTLATGTVSVDNGDYSYDQYIDLADSAAPIFGVDPDDDSSTAALYLKFDSGNPLYTYKLSFSKALDADDTDAADDNVDELENAKIQMLGKDYTITKALWDGTSDLKLELMGGAAELTQGEYTTQTYTINGKTYEVEVLIIADTPQTCKLKVNGQTTLELKAGQTFKLSDGTEVGIKEVLPNEGSEAAGADQVTFYLGADKVTLQDTDITDDAAGESNLIVGSTSIDNTEVSISGSGTATNVKVSAIQIMYTPDDDLFVGVDGKVSEKITDTGALIKDSFDYQYLGLTSESTEDIKVSKSNDEEYKLDFTAKDGALFNKELFAVGDGADEATDVFLGTLSGTTFYDFHVLTEAADITDEETFVVTAGDYSHIFQYKDIDATKNEIKIKDLNTDETTTLTYTAGATIDGTADATLYFHGYTIGVDVNDAAGGNIRVDMDDDNDFTSTGLTIKTQYGATISFTGFTAADDADIVSIETEDLEDSTTDTLDIALTYNVAGAYVDADYDAGLLATFKYNDNTDKEVGYAKYGLYMENDYTNDANAIKVVYPDNQLFHSAYVSAGAVATTSTSGSVNVNYINAATGIARTDADFASAVPSKNVILLGGPTVNELVSDLATAGKTWTSAEWATKVDTAVIQLVESAYGANSALIIAGYEAKDTALAGKVLASRLTQNQFATELTGTTVTLSTAGASTVNEVTFS